MCHQAGSAYMQCSCWLALAASHITDGAATLSHSVPLGLHRYHSVSLFDFPSLSAVLPCHMYCTHHRLLQLL